MNNVIMEWRREQTRAYNTSITIKEENIYGGRRVMLRAQVRINGRLMAIQGHTTDRTQGQTAGRCDVIRKFVRVTCDNRLIPVNKVVGDLCPAGN